MSEPADDQVQVNRVADEIGALERGVALRNAAEALVLAWQTPAGAPYAAELHALINTYDASAN